MQQSEGKNAKWVICSTWPPLTLSAADAASVTFNTVLFGLSVQFFVHLNIEDVEETEI